MDLVLYGLLAILVAAALFLLATRFLPAGEQIAPAVRDESPWELPAERSLHAGDVESVRLPVALRGYRFAETDTLLDRLAGELRVRDEEIARLRGYTPAPGNAPIAAGPAASGSAASGPAAPGCGAAGPTAPRSGARPAPAARPVPAAPAPPARPAGTPASPAVTAPHDRAPHDRAPHDRAPHDPAPHDPAPRESDPITGPQTRTHDHS